MEHDKNTTDLSVGSLRKKLASAYKRIRALEKTSGAGERQEGQQQSQHQALAQNEAFLEQSAEIAHLGYAIWDDTLDRDITVTEELARIHGLTRVEYLKAVSNMGKYLDFIVPDDREEYQKYEDEFAIDPLHDAAGVEYCIVRADGEIRHLHQRSQYIPVSSGEPTQSIVVIQDVTEQKQAEVRLKESQEVLEEREAMLNQSATMANLGHSVWDEVNEKYVTVSESWASIHGYTKEKYLALFTGVEADNELIHPEDRDRYHAYFDKYMNAEQVPDIEYRIVRRDGNIRHVLERFKYIQNEFGERTKSLVTIQDITNRVEREQELSEARNAAEQASVAKSSFLALMSHEIRTPLNAVLGALGLIDAKDLDPSLREFLNVGRKGAESLLAIINDILDFSKMEAGKLQLEPALFNVRKAVDDVLLVLEPRALERNISLTGDLDLDVPGFLIGDAGRIRQVLLNLCSNAVRFTTEGGVHITLSKPQLRDELTHVRFQVEDTGCGVPLEDQQHLFEEFWGTNTTTLGDVGSTGLGLPICQQLVEMMGGSISFESKPGRGSTFWFELPLETPSEEVVNVEKNRSRQFDQIDPHTDLPALEARVLLAEDNPANQLIGQALLERIGLQVDVVANGREVVAALGSVPYDAVLMDINMPEMDGIEATAAIRKLPGAISSIPIIAMTAMAMAGDRERFMSQGMDGYISKPILREELYACIASVLNGLEPLPASTNSSSDTKRTYIGSSIIDAKIFGILKVDVGAELLPQIIDTYLSELPARVDAIIAAAACGNCELVAKEAHPLKSSSSSLGAIVLAELANQLENAGREHDLDKIVQEASRLPSVFEQTREQLLEYGKSKDSTSSTLSQ